MPDVLLKSFLIYAKSRADSAFERDDLFLEKVINRITKAYARGVSMTSLLPMRC